MENKKKEERERKNVLDPTTLPITSSFRSKLLLALIIIAVVSLGLLAVNQFLSFNYKAQLLGSPCTLCLELNPHLEDCFLSPEKNKINNNKIVFNFTPSS